MLIFKEQVDTINGYRVNYWYRTNMYKFNLISKWKALNTAYEGTITKMLETALNKSCTVYLSFYFLITQTMGVQGYEYRTRQQTLNGSISLHKEYGRGAKFSG